MAQQWPTTAPSVSPGTHDPVATQAYQAGGGDYFRTGYYSLGTFAGIGPATLSIAANTLYLRPFHIPVRRSFDRIGVNVTTAAAAGGVLRLGIYTSVDGVPGALLLDAGTVSSTSIGGKEITISQAVEPGIAWLACVAQVASCTVTALNSSEHSSPYMSTTTTPPVATGTFAAFVTTGVSGALPASVTPSTVGGFPLVALRPA